MKVFISYCWDCEEHKDWVKRLADTLLENGIDVILDQYDLQFGMDRFRFMEDSVRDADYVLCVCTPEYVKRANSRERGTGQETRLITPEFFEDHPKKTFIPILRKADSRIGKVPRYMATLIYMDFRDDAIFDGRVNELLRYLHNQPKHPKPPLGPTPDYGKSTISVRAGASERLLRDLAAQFEDELAKGEQYIIPELEIAVGTSKRGKKNQDSLDIKDLIESPENYVILAPSGMGKTCLLNHIGRTILAEGAESAGIDTIPIKIHIADLITGSNRKIEDIVYDRTQVKLKEYDLTGKRLLWLLDGLDQLRMDADYGRLNDILCGNIKLISRLGSEFKMIIASRPTYERRLHATQGDNFKHLLLKPFDDSRIKRYLGTAHAAITASPMARGIGGLLSTPILLKMVRDLFYEADLTIRVTSRYSLYKNFTDILFRKETQRKHLDIDERNDVIDSLSHISCHALEQGSIGSVLMVDVDSYLHPDPGHTKRDQLKAWCIIHDILEEGDNSVLLYTHQSFQEYFASLLVYSTLIKLNNSSVSNKDLSSYIYNHLEYFYWDEVWQFVLERINGGETSNDERKRTEAESIRKTIFRGTSTLCKRLAHAPEAFGMVLSPVLPNQVEEKMKEMFNIHQSYWRASIALHFLAAIPSPQSVEMLKTFAMDPKVGTRTFLFEGSVRALIAMNSEIADTALIEIIKSKGEGHVFSMISNGLGKNRSHKAIEFFLNLLITYPSDDEDDSDYVRRISAIELGNIGSQLAFSSLLDVLKNVGDRPVVRTEAARAISKIDPISAQPILTDIMKDREDHSKVRYAAAQALLETDTTGSFVIPSDIVKDTEPFARFVATVWAGPRYSVPERPREYPASDSSSVSRDVDTSFSPPASFLRTKSLLQNRSTDITMRLSSVTTLMEIDLMAAEPILMAIVKDQTESQKLRWVAARSIRYTEHPESIPFLEELVNGMYSDDSDLDRVDRFDLEWALSQIAPSTYLIDRIDFFFNLFYSGSGYTSLARLVFSRLGHSEKEAVVAEYCARMMREKIESDQFFAHMVSFFMVDCGHRFIRRLTRNQPGGKR